MIYVRKIHKRADDVENLKNRTNSKQQHTTWIRANINEQYQKRMHEQGHTQTDMEEMDRLALERKNLRSLS